VIDVTWKDILKQDLENDYSISVEYRNMIKSINRSIDRAIEEVSRQIKTNVDSRAMGQLYGTYTLDISSTEGLVDRLKDKMAEVGRKNNNTGISGNTPEFQTIRQSGITSLEKYIPKYLKEKYGLNFNTARISGDKMTLK
jgi:hypothetical protein